LFSLPPELASHLGSSGTLLVPTRQRLRAVQLAHAAAALTGGLAVWDSPDVLTPAAFARRACERLAACAPQEWPRLLSGTEEWALWRAAAAEAAHGLDLLDTGALGEALGQAAQLAATWGISAAGAQEGEAGLMREAQQLFDARCRELRSASVTSLLPQLAAHGTLRAPAPLLAGFDALPPRIAALGRVSGDAPVAALALPQVVRPADAQAELDAITHWCVTRLREAPGARLLVMLPGASGARARLAALIAQALDAPRVFGATDSSRALVGIEGGEPFAQQPLPRAALAGLALLGGETLEVDAFSEWLRSPFFSTPKAPQRAALARLVAERSGASVDLHGLLGALQLPPPGLKPAARALDGLLRRAGAALSDGSASPRRWSERIAAALAELTWPGEAASHPQLRETRNRFHELLEEFGELAISTPILRRAEALGLLAALARRTAYRPADEDVPVTLSPVLADPVVHYDGIWVARLSAEVLPAPLAPDPFLSLAAQLQAGVPQSSAAARRAQAQALLGAWRRGAASLVLSAPEREGDLELLPSPLLSGFPAMKGAGHAHWLPARLARTGLTERLEDPRGLRFNPLVPLTSGTRALTLQMACPFHAYAELRLGAQALESAQPGVAADQRGTLLHEALQLLWVQLKDSATLSSLSEAQLKSLIGAAVAQAAVSLAAQPRGHRRRRYQASEGQFDLFRELSPALTRECRRAEGLILRLCQLELTRAPFVVEGTEAVAELTLGGGRVRMRLDRVDRVAEGRVILDYKSGRPGSPDWFGERPAHPQLLAYLAALGRDVVALATVHLTAREVRFCGVGASAQLLPKLSAVPPERTWSAQQAAWEGLLERLVGEFLQGEARVDPAPGACDYCHLASLCRIGAHQAPELQGTLSAGDADD
jgi:ATP-dependent helicase/nuclease subunit B